MLKYNEETFIYEEQGVERGYCIIDQIQDYVLVAYLAVYEGNRGKGIGTKIFKQKRNITRSRRPRFCKK